jgi:hypothetical protein
MKEKFESWLVEHDGHGHIAVCHETRAESYSVDASNPLLDKSLVEFWRTFSGSTYVAMQVERIASAYRRALLGSDEWGRVLVEAAEANAHQATSEDRGSNRLLRALGMVGGVHT